MLQDMEPLLASNEPSIRWKARVNVLGESPTSASICDLRDEIRRSERVRELLARRGPAGRFGPDLGVYAKWQGAHWVFAALADLGYPEGDADLLPLRDQVLDAWLKPTFFREIELDRKQDAYKHDAVPIMEGRHRRCASQQGNALLSAIRLGLVDDRVDRLAERLLHWQWPDGGWNCDKDPGADSSSFMETLLAMRALHAYAAVRSDADAQRAAARAAEVFLERRLFRRRSDGRVIREEFTKLHYPLYWHYDVLGGLVGLAEVGRIGDPRCSEVLDLLEAKRLPGGGWPAEARYYKVTKEIGLGHSDVDWGGTSVRRMNAWVTVEALGVLRAGGRLDQ